MQTVSSLALLCFVSCVSASPPPDTGMGGFREVRKEGSPRDRPESPLQDPPSEENSILPQGLSSELLVKSAVSLLDEDYGPVIHQDAPWCLVHDLDKNGYADLLLLTLQSEKGAPVSSEGLMDSRRLFEDSSLRENFRVAIFYQYPDKVIKRYSIPLENKLILQDFRFQEIRRGQDFPYSLSVSFKSTEGTEEEWIILHGRGISRFTIEQNLSKESWVEDIDEDGFIDVVEYHKGFEDGSGYETFITWYRWNGREFKVNATTNVVRNLRLFFSQTEKAVIAEGWTSLIPRLESSILEKLRSQGLDEKDIFNRFFPPLSGTENPRELLNIEPVGLVFPSILENPFTQIDSSRQEFSFILKVHNRSGKSYFFQCLLGMSGNLFSGPQFMFLPVP